RVLRNRLTRELDAHESELPGFPVQLFLTEDLRQAAAEQGVSDLMALWANQGCRLGKSRPVAEAIRAWTEQVATLLEPQPSQLEPPPPESTAQASPIDENIDPACFI
ncbi:MAG: hypothetical protein IAF00_09970, partial [Phycisphaerales bacterium]|nr:hypothetical protein [Phycisphaerales bacterium]